MKKLYNYILCVLLLTQGPCTAYELLNLNDIHSTMQQILSQHVDQKEIDGKIIRHALKIYIDKFDPERIYLLEAEIDPYLNLSETQSQTAVEAYKHNQFPNFERLNFTIQTAILRSRMIRKELEKNPDVLFKKRLATNEQNSKFDDPDLKLKFPKNKDELRQNIENNLIQFIDAEKQRFSKSTVMNNELQTLEIYEKNLQDKEETYLYRNHKGAPFTKAEQENAFTMHILKALASSLDAHTAFYSESEATDLKTLLEKEFQGIGIVFKQIPSGDIAISDLTAGGPAAKSGVVKINDLLVEINGAKVGKSSLEKVVETIRNNKNPTISLTLKHKGQEETFKVSLQKEELTIQANRVDSSYRKVDDGIIGIMNLHSFYQGSNDVTSENDIRKALTGFKQKGNLKGLILDLRENSGGFLGQAVKVAGLFITSGVIVISKYFNGEEHYYRDIDGKSYYEGPLVILTSRLTASAAEIVAQALQDYGVALIVGDETTYGKGTIQNQNVTGNSAKGSMLFKVTVGKYYTVSGKTPQIEGVKADIVVPGLYNFEHLGEQYLEYTVPNDKIKNEYVDDLEDVAPNLRSWYQLHYLSTIQQKNSLWQSMLPALRANSAKRLAESKQYQKFLGLLREGHPTVFYARDPAGNPKAIDFQLNEALNIVKDMIQLQQQERSKKIVNDAKKGVAEKAAFSYD